MLLFGGHRRARIDESRRLRSDLAEAVRRRLDLGDDAVVRVAEVRCGDPGCPDVETIVLLMRPGRPSEALKIPRSMAALTSSDLDELAAEFLARCSDLSVAVR